MAFGTWRGDRQKLKENAIPQVAPIRKVVRALQEPLRYEHEKNV